MSLYQHTNKIVFKENKLPDKKTREQLGIKKTGLYTRDTNKPIYSMEYLNEKDPKKQFHKHQYFKNIKGMYNPVVKEEKRFSDQKSKNLYFEDKDDS